MSRPITPRQRAVLGFLVDFIVAQGYPPALTDIMVRFRIGSKRGVTVHLDALEHKGYITRAVATSRGLQITAAGVRELGLERQRLPDRGEYFCLDEATGTWEPPLPLPENRPEDAHV